jgi:hypothetical protein
MAKIANKDTGERGSDSAEARARRQQILAKVPQPTYVPPVLKHVPQKWEIPPVCERCKKPIPKDEVDAYRAEGPGHEHDSPARCEMCATVIKVVDDVEITMTDLKVS